MSTTNAWLTRNGPNLEIPNGKHILNPWGQGLKYSPNLAEVIASRPRIIFRDHRVCKDTVYLKSIRQMCGQHNIHGNYVGLAAAHAPEIYAALHPYIHGQFVSYQNTDKDFNKVLPFMKKLNHAHERQCYTQFGLELGDILTSMLRMPLGFCSIGDLDRCQPLTRYSIIEIAQAFRHIAADMSVLSVWHTVPRMKGTGVKAIGQLRKSLDNRLGEHFKVVDKDEISYYEPQTEDGRTGTPMRVDVYTLKRRISIKIEQETELKRRQTEGQEEQEQEERKFQEQAWKIQQESVA